MVRSGWAVDFRRYSKGAYADEEAQARAARRGLWAGEFEVPAQWRKTH
jgi:endonuclease YncB( thermonuclease family)